jgi:hypothetical protein
MNINLYTPHDKQKEIHTACSLNDPCFFITVVAGRRGGKTMAAINQTIFWASKYPGCKIWYVTPVESQGLIVLEALYNSIKGSSLIKTYKKSKGSMELVFTNGSRIDFKSASSGQNLRGAEVNFMIIDEAGYISNSVIDEAIMPTLAAGGKKCLIISTPKGKNWFYRWYLKGLDKAETKYKSFKFLSSDNPKVDKSLIELFRQAVPEAVYRQEYLGSFEDSAAVFRNIDEVCILNTSGPEAGVSYYAGIDIGMLSDDTVVSIINDKGELVYIDRFTGLESPELKERILKTLKLWRPVETVMEQNNQGLTILQEMKRYWPTLKGFVTTNKSKEEIINRLVSAFSGLSIKCLKDNEIISQLQGFIFELTSTGKIRYCAASGFHDDIVMSMAIAWDCYVTNIGLGGKYNIGVITNNLVKSFINDDNQLNFDNDLKDEKLNKLNEMNSRFYFLGSGGGLSDSTKNNNEQNN